ncbi:hypothetical protein ES705_24769 [subsurface metagenome]
MHHLVNKYLNFKNAFFFLSLLLLILLPLLSLDAGISGDEELNVQDPVSIDDMDPVFYTAIIQYCLSYHNEGCGFGLYEFGAAKPWENNIVRYNISQDDGIINGGSVGIWRHESRGTMRNCDIYNNTFYNSNPNSPSLWIYNNWPGFNFRNNIFIYDGSLVYPGQKIETELFQGNCFWNLKEMFELAPGSQDIVGTSIPLGTGYDIGAIEYIHQEWLL